MQNNQLDTLLQMYVEQKRGQHTQPLKLPDIGLHPDSPERIPPQVRQPNLDHFGIPILNLDQSPQRDPLKILLALFVHKIRPEHGPALHDLGQGDGTFGVESEVESRAHGEVGHEFHIADREGAELQRADRVVVS